MKNLVNKKRIVILLVATLAVSACQTVSMPKLDFIKTAEFSEDAANIDQTYPDVQDAPELPTDVRSSRQWDKDARAMQALRKKTPPVNVGQGESADEAEARFEQLKAKARAYKNDDPASGPVEGFPSYKPRR